MTNRLDDPELARRLVQSAPSTNTQTRPEELPLRSNEKECQELLPSIGRGCSKVGGEGDGIPGRHDKVGRAVLSPKVPYSCDKGQGWI